MKHSEPIIANEKYLPSDHNRIVPSELPDKHCVPSLLTTNAFTLSVCP